MDKTVKGEMSHEKHLSKTYLCKSIGIGKSNLSKPKYKGMPNFYNVEDFKVWYEGQRIRQPSLKLEEASIPLEKNDTLSPAPPPYEFDIDGCERAGDFDELMVKDSQMVTHIAVALLRQVAAKGDLVKVKIATSNWSDACKQSRAVRAEYLDLLERRQEVLTMDSVLHVTGTVVREFVTFLSRFGSVIASSANPENPSVALAVINDACDSFILKQGNMEDRVVAQLLSDDKTD